MSAARREPRSAASLLRTSSFEVLIGDHEIGFAQVGRLTSGRPADHPAGGGADGRADDGTQGFASVVLRRALSTSRDLFDWRRAVAAGREDRRDVTIRQLSAPGGEVVNAWRLVRAWPLRWSGPGFDAMHDDIAVEEVELAFEDLVWLDHDSTRGG